MSQDIQAVSAAFKVIGEATGWQVVGAIAAAGTVAMAILQVVKELTPLRRYFQRWWIRGWIAARVDEFNRRRQSKGVDSTTLTPATAGKTEMLLIELSTGGDDRAFYELPIEQMVAQMNAAVQITLDYPKRYYDLLVIVSEGADPDDVATVITSSPTGTRAKKAQPSQHYLEARTRVSHRIQRNLDAIQISLGNRWQFCMQFTALVLSTLMLEAAVLSVAGATIGTVVIALLIGMVGGYLAPVTRDLVAALQTLRK